MNQVRISILTVCFNSERTIARTIESVLNQTYPPYEYFVIDGKSQDNTVVIAEHYISAFAQKGIIYRVISEEDCGMYDALNKGARMATGILVGQINSDDWYELDALQKMTMLFKKENFDMAYAHLRMINPDGSTWIKKARVDKFVNSRHWNHPTQFTKRELLLEHPYPCECMSDDLDLILWARSLHKNVKALNNVVSNFSVEGMSHSKDWNAIIDRIKTKTRIYKRYGYSFFHVIDVASVEFCKYILEK